MSEQQARPGQATLAGVLIIAGSILLVATAWERVAGLHTLEVREGVERWVARNNVEGMSVDDILTTIRVLCMVGAGAAAAAAILGYQVFRRSASARVALAILAPLLLVGALVAGTPLGILAVAGVGMLWAQPTRDWYAGRPWAQRHEERREQRVAALRSGSPTAPPQGSAPPAPASPAEAAHPADPSRPAGPPAAGYRLPPERPLAVRRPGALVSACVLTWVLAGITALGAALTAVAVALEHERLFADLREQQPEVMDSTGLSDAELVTAMTVVASGVVLWSLVALVLAGLAFAGQEWARVVLAVSGVCAGVLCLVMALSLPPLLVFALAVGTGTWLLLRPEVAAWYRLRRAVRR